MFKIGDIVYVNTAYLTADKCEIIGLISKEQRGIDGYQVHSLDSWGTFGIRKENVFSTKEEAVDSYIKTNENRKQLFKEKIKDAKDLISFALIQIPDEYADESAVAALKERAMEILDIPAEEFKKQMDEWRQILCEK